MPDQLLLLHEEMFLTHDQIPFMHSERFITREEQFAAQLQFLALLRQHLKAQGHSLRLRVQSVIARQQHLAAREQHLTAQRHHFRVRVRARTPHSAPLKLEFEAAQPQWLRGRPLFLAHERRFPAENVDWLAHRLECGPAKPDWRAGILRWECTLAGYLARPIKSRTDPADAGQTGLPRGVSGSQRRGNAGNVNRSGEL